MVSQEAENITLLTTEVGLRQREETKLLGIVANLEEDVRKEREDRRLENARLASSLEGDMRRLLDRVDSCLPELRQPVSTQILQHTQSMQQLVPSVQQPKVTQGL